MISLENYFLKRDFDEKKSARFYLKIERHSDWILGSLARAGRGMRCTAHFICAHNLRVISIWFKKKRKAAANYAITDSDSHVGFAQIKEIRKWNQTECSNAEKIYSLNSARQFKIFVEVVIKL